LIKQAKEGNSIIIKGNNNYQPTCTQSQCTQFHPTDFKGLKAHTDSNTVVVEDFTTPLPIDMSFKQKINKEILELNHTIDQMDLAEVYRIFHPISAQYTFFSAAQGTFSKIDHILGHKASLSKYKKIEIIPCILSGHNALKLELNNKNNSRKHANNWKLNNTLPNGQWVIMK
jgi:exonuclease III